MECASKFERSQAHTAQKKSHQSEDACLWISLLPCPGAAYRLSFSNALLICSPEVCLAGKEMSMPKMLWQAGATVRTSVSFRREGGKFIPNLVAQLTS